MEGRGGKGESPHSLCLVWFGLGLGLGLRFGVWGFGVALLGFYVLFRVSLVFDQKQGPGLLIFLSSVPIT